MKAFLSSILLIIYTVTCTGANIYVHQCQQMASASVKFQMHQEQEDDQTCPMCLDQKQPKEPSSSHKKSTQDDCCKDLTVELKKGQEETEMTVSTNPGFLQSPATFTIIWKLACPPLVDTDRDWSEPDRLLPANLTSPTYLLLRNFRI